MWYFHLLCVLVGVAGDMNLDASRHRADIYPFNPTKRAGSRRYCRPELQEGKMIRATGLIFGFLMISVLGSAFATTVKQEPPLGAMREGQVLLVDDGSCPAGQIKRVVGGNHTKVGGTKQVVRTSSCVPR
jgi:hypothetical protein